MKMQDSGSVRPRGLRFAIQSIFGLALIVGIVVLLLLLDIFPHLPNSPIGWVILVGLGVPFWLLLEWFGQKILSKKLGHRISERPFSGIRIICAFAAILIFCAGILALWKLSGHWIRPYFS